VLTSTLHSGYTLGDLNAFLKAMSVELQVRVQCVWSFR
jgi:hypothetical protein